MMEYISLMRDKALKIKQYYGMTEMEMNFIENLQSKGFEKIAGTHTNHIINNADKDQRKNIKGKLAIRKYWDQNKVFFQDIGRQL